MKTFLKLSNCRDVYVTSEPTKLPNATRTGYGERFAKPGDFVIISDGDAMVARVLARIVEHVPDGSPETCVGWLVVLVLSPATGAHAYVRWFDPAKVTYCEGPERAAEFISRFLSASTDQLLAYAKDYDARLLKKGGES